MLAPASTMTAGRHCRRHYSCHCRALASLTPHSPAPTCSPTQALLDAVDAPLCLQGGQLALTALGLDAALHPEQVGGAAAA